MIFLALAFGIALRRLRHEPVGDVDQLSLVAFNALVIVLHWVLEVIPLAVFGIVTALIADGKFHDFVGLGRFCVVGDFGAAAAIGLLSDSHPAGLVGPADGTDSGHARRAGDGFFHRQLDRHDAGDLCCSKERVGLRGIGQHGGPGRIEFQQRRHRSV